MVTALMGEAQWCLPENDMQVMTDQLKWLASYQQQAKQSDKFRQIHVDVEPWGLKPQWVNDQHLLLQKYFQILGEIKRCGVALQLPVMVDLPFWANQVATNIYDGTDTFTTLDIAVLDIVDSITFMTYRNTVTEVVGLAQPLLISLGARYPYKKIFIAVETLGGNIADVNQISYFGQSKSRVMSDLRKIDKQLKQYPNFGGISVHDYRAFQVLI